jgi:NIMA (never in mitosis gene a)-related kinase
MLVALKELPLTDVGIFGVTDAERNEGVKNMNKEVEILSSLAHPNIVQVGAQNDCVMHASHGVFPYKSKGS